MNINKNINDLYNLTYKELFYEQIYKPEKIENNIIYKNYTTLNLHDMPKELKLFLKDVIITIKLKYETKDIINNSYDINYFATIFINIKEIQELINKITLNFKANYKKINETTTQLSFIFNHDKNYIDNDINPINKILFLIFSNYIDNIVIPNIKNNYQNRLLDYISC